MQANRFGVFPFAGADCAAVTDCVVAEICGHSGVER
jgi:hypothetical protein